MATFEENLNFIFKFKRKISNDFFKDAEYIENYLKEALKIFNSDVVELKNNKSKLIKEVINIQKIIKTFIKKAKNYMDRRVLINNEATKLLKEAGNPPVTPNSLIQKSDILADKLKYKKVEMEFIENFVKETKQSLENLGVLGDDFDSNIVLKCIKGILKKTEEYNIGRLKRAQQKFEKSKELKDFMYGKKNPKLAHLLSLDSAVPVDEEEASELKTPFGSVWVKKGGKSDRIIYNDQSATKAPNYDEMCEKLDSIIENVHQAEINYKIKISNVISLIEPIIKYINQPLTIRQHNTSILRGTSPAKLFDTIKFNFQINERILSDEQREAAAFLCGVLLLSESHEFRNPTGGKFERKAMKNVLRLAKNNCLNPFAVVFNRAKGRYIPAHDERSLKKVTRGSKKATTGGVKQTIRVLDEHNIPMEALTESNKNVYEYWKGKITFYLNKKKLNIKLKKPNSNTPPTPSTKAVGAKDIINDLNSEDEPDPIYLTREYYNNVEENMRPTITKDIINDLRKLVQFSKMTNNATIDIDNIPEFIRSDIKTEINRNKKLINKLMNNSLH